MIRNRKFNISVICLLLCGCLFASTAFSENTESSDTTWQWDLDLATYSSYMFRGTRPFDGVSLQPATTIGYNLGEGLGTIEGGLWSHIPAESNTEELKFVELDESISYTNNIGIVDFALGTVWYTYFNDDSALDESAEIFASVGFDVLLNPTASWYYDYRTYYSHYFELGLSHTFEIAALGDGFNLTPFVNFGFDANGNKVYDRESGIVQASYGVSSEVAMGDITVTPSLTMTSGIDDATVNQFWFGMSFGYSKGF